MRSLGNVLETGSPLTGDNYLYFFVNRHILKFELEGWAMNLQKIFIMLLGIMIFFLFGTKDIFAFSVISPLNESFVEHESVNIVLQMNENELDSVDIKVNDFEYPPVDFEPGKKYFCFNIIIVRGMNELKLTGYKNNKIVDTKNFNIYFRSDLNQKFKKAPRGYKRYYFHVEEREDVCKQCHNLNPTLSDLKPDAPEASPCYSCHRSKIEKNKDIHAPVKKWGCLECHKLRKGERKYSIDKPVVDTCYLCHGTKVSSWKKKRTMHGPTAVGQCTICHDPHGSDWPKFIRMFATDLCLNCHQGLDTGMHVIAGFYGKGHPVRGVPHPLKPNEEFSCAGCHNPHGSYNNRLLNFKGNNTMKFCLNCHKK